MNSLSTTTSHWDPEHAGRWRDVDAAETYENRPPYPPETFDVLRSLVVDEPLTALDVGCGTGNLTRGLATHVDRVDAVDLSAEMVAVGRRLAGSRHSNIRWQVAPAEVARLDPPYALIVGGESLHWMDWPVILPRFADTLTAAGVLAVVQVKNAEPLAWDQGLGAIIARYSTDKGYAPFDMIAAWENAKLFRRTGEYTTAPVIFEQPLEAFIAAFHAMSTLTRAHIDHLAFDGEVRGLMEPYCPQGIVSRQITAHITWGRPLAAVAEPTGD